MSEDFDVVSGPPARPPKIKPSAPPDLASRRNNDRDKMATLPKDSAGGK